MTTITTKLHGLSVNELADLIGVSRPAALSAGADWLAHVRNYVAERIEYAIAANEPLPELRSLIRDTVSATTPVGASELWKVWMDLRLWEYADETVRLARKPLRWSSSIEMTSEFGYSEELPSHVIGIACRHLARIIVSETGVEL